MIRDNYLNINKIITDKKILRLFRAVESHGGVLRFVGGCVRDALMGIKGFDIDLATDLCPDELVEACLENGLKTVPVGLKYGTVGVMIDDKILEVTTLRKDIKTDGRHTEIEYTSDWDVDASRRDLTINAVYADEKGNVFDYFNGISDLENGIVKFIGSPSQRIKEDYLRILRFFRFYSIFGKTPIDEKALKACFDNKDGLKQLSTERIRDEFQKIVQTKNSASILRLIFDYGILDNILPIPKNFDILEKFVPLSSDPLLRFFVLYMPDVALAENLAIRLKISNKKKERFMNLAKTNFEAKDFLDDQKLYKNIYSHGKEFMLDKLLILMALNKINPSIRDEKELQINNFIIPVFPLKGKDLIDAGLKAGAGIKEALKKLEQIWIENNFSLSGSDLLRNL